jgi:hypothetical protein
MALATEAAGPAGVTIPRWGKPGDCRCGRKTFFRSIGGSFGVAIFGTRLASEPRAGHAAAGRVFEARRQGLEKMLAGWSPGSPSSPHSPRSLLEPS